MNISREHEEFEEKPRTMAQKWARIEKINAKVDELLQEKVMLTEELRSSL